MKDIPDKSIDMVLTSSPYDNLRDYKGYTFNFEGIAKEIYRVLKDGGGVFGLGRRCQPLKEVKQERVLETSTLL